MYRIIAALSLMTLPSQLSCNTSRQQIEEHNVSFGVGALSSLKKGDLNTAEGAYALGSLEDGSGNTALGAFTASGLTKGSDNILIGLYSGQNITHSTNGTILIGNSGTDDDSCTIRIGDDQSRCFIAGIQDAQLSDDTALSVVINADGQLGTSSRIMTIIEQQDEAIKTLVKQIDLLTQRIEILEAKQKQG